MTVYSICVMGCSDCVFHLCTGCVVTVYFHLCTGGVVTVYSICVMGCSAQSLHTQYRDGIHSHYTPLHRWNMGCSDCILAV